jgi:hypothetical protein
MLCQLLAENTTEIIGSNIQQTGPSSRKINQLDLSNYFLKVHQLIYLLWFFCFCILIFFKFIHGFDFLSMT